jgi:hypothetical protein
MEQASLHAGVTYKRNMYRQSDKQKNARVHQEQDKKNTNKK